MNRLAAFLLSALLLGALAFALSYRFATRPMREMARNPDQGVAWLAQEFSLTPEQTLQVQDLTDAYDPRCMEMCRKINESNRHLDFLISGGNQVTPAIAEALRQSADLEADCRREMLVHIYAIAEVLPSKQRTGYLDLMKMRVLTQSSTHQTGR